MPATGDPKQAAWVCRMFGLEGTLFLEFLFFTGDSEEWEVALGVTVSLLPYSLLSAVKNISPGARGIWRIS